MAGRESSSGKARGRRKTQAPARRNGGVSSRRGQRDQRGSQRPHSGARSGGGSSARRPASSRGTRQARLRRGLAAKRASGAARVLGLSTTRRAAVLAIVVCALAFTVAVPLRTYISQQSELTVQQQRQAELQAKVRRLRERKEELNNPAVIESEARRRLGYVMPGETPYLVQLPGDQAVAPQQQDAAPAQQQESWYARLWTMINGAGGADDAAGAGAGGADNGGPR